MPHESALAQKRLDGRVNKKCLLKTAMGGLLTLVQLFERERFRFRDKEQDCKKSDDVPRGIPPERTLRLKCSQ
jgi:hypothetical protein